MADLEKAKREARERNKDIANVGTQEGQTVVNTGPGEERVPDTGAALAKSEARERAAEADRNKAAAGAMAIAAQDAERDVAKYMSATSDLYGTGKTRPEELAELNDEAQKEARKMVIGDKKIMSDEERWEADASNVSERTRGEMEEGRKALSRYGGGTSETSEGSEKSKKAEHDRVAAERAATERATQAQAATERNTSERSQSKK